LKPSRATWTTFSKAPTHQTKGKRQKDNRKGKEEKRK